MTRGKGAVTEVKRKLAAILSAELVGYSRLMGDDEHATMDTLNTYRDAFRRHIGAHDGRVVDNARDSVLAVFDSVVEAITAAPTCFCGRTIWADHRLYR